MLIMVFVEETIRESVMVSIVLFSLRYLIGETFYIDCFYYYYYFIRQCLPLSLQRKNEKL